MGYQGIASNYDDNDLVPVNVKSGVDIFGVNGSFVGGGNVSGNLGFTDVSWAETTYNMGHGIGATSAYFEDAINEYIMGASSYKPQASGTATGARGFLMTKNKATGLLTFTRTAGSGQAGDYTNTTADYLGAYQEPSGQYLYYVMRAYGASGSRSPVRRWNTWVVRYDINNNMAMQITAHYLTDDNNVYDVYAYLPAGATPYVSSGTTKWKLKVPTPNSGVTVPIYYIS